MDSSLVHWFTRESRQDIFTFSSRELLRHLEGMDHPRGQENREWTGAGREQKNGARPLSGVTSTHLHKRVEGNFHIKQDKKVTGKAGNAACTC